MASHPNDFKFFIKDSNGQPQMVKIVPSTALQLQSSGSVGSPFKIPAMSEGSIVIRSVPGAKPKYVQVPIEQFKQLQKGASESAAAQSASTVKKVQINNISEGSKTIHTVPTLVQQQAPKQNFDKALLNNSIMGYGNRKRHNSENDITADYSSKRRKNNEKSGKGLRHFSMKVCEKVRKKGFTSYNEVADELVSEFTSDVKGCPDNQHYDHKNIRRRVYDALNVLMAMNIISKEKKEIRWLGLPTNCAQECMSLENEKQSILNRIEQKTQKLNESILKQISFQCLVERNKEAENKGLVPSSTSAIQLPFIVINTNEKTIINCSISNDRMEYVFNFNDKFQIQDDIDILKRMGLVFGLDKGECTQENIKKAKKMVPKSLENYVDQLAQGARINIDDLLNIKCEDEDLGEGSFNGDLDIEDYDESSMQYSGEGDDDQEETSDLDYM